MDGSRPPQAAAGRTDGPFPGVVLRIWVTPRSRSERLGRLADGRIRAFVGAPLERGEANARLIRLLAQALRVPQDSIQILSGTSHTRKLVRISEMSRREVNGRIKTLRAGHYIGGGSVRRGRQRERALGRSRAANSG